MKTAPPSLTLLPLVRMRSGAENRSSPMSCLEAVIFDFDGVVVDSHPAHRQAWKAFFRSLEMEVPDAELAFIQEGRKREDVLRHFLGDITPEQVESYGARKDAILKDFAQEL